MLAEPGLSGSWAPRPTLPHSRTHVTQVLWAPSPGLPCRPLTEQRKGILSDLCKEERLGLHVHSLFSNGKNVLKCRVLWPQGEEAPPMELRFT